MDKISYLASVTTLTMAAVINLFNILRVWLPKIFIWSCYLYVALNYVIYVHGNVGTWIAAMSQVAYVIMSTCVHLGAKGLSGMDPKEQR